MGLFLTFILALQQPQIDEAIRKGIAHLKAKASTAGEREEQLLLALVEVGVPPSDPTVAGMLETLLAHPPTTTRSAARQARILSLLDRNAYRDRLGHCAQFLVDNQSRDGRWGPGQPVEAPDLHPEPLEPPSARTPNHVFGASSQVIFKILFRRKVPVAETGDLENSYAAILGLSACRSAGILAPRETLEKALETWRVAEVDPFRRVAALLAYQSLLHRKDPQDPALLKAMEEVEARRLPSEPQALFQLKQTLRTWGRDQLGGKEWWPEGAKVLLDTQAADGDWGSLEDTGAALGFLYLPRPTGIPEEPRRKSRR